MNRGQVDMTHLKLANVAAVWGGGAALAAPESLLWSRDLPTSPWSCTPEHPEADPNFNTESGAHGHFGSAAWHSASTTYSKLHGLAV